jgi:MtfA peptidase
MDCKGSRGHGGRNQNCWTQVLEVNARCLKYSSMNMRKTWRYRWLDSWRNSWHQRWSQPRTLPDALWRSVLAHYSFLAARPPAELIELRALTARFLSQKEFSGAQGLVVTDTMAVAVAAQACLPVLHLGLKLYDDFAGIVIHPGAMLARRSVVDAAGVLHHYNEALVGEAMQGGPVTLSWEDIAAAGVSAERGHNVVIHEFIHKIDMRKGHANGCPPLPTRAAQLVWQTTMRAAFENFREHVTMAERFGAEAPWLDAYGATAPAEFFAVAAEAYFVNPERFERECATLKPLFDAYFKPNTAVSQ